MELAGVDRTRAVCAGPSRAGAVRLVHPGAGKRRAHALVALASAAVDRIGGVGGIHGGIPGANRRGARQPETVDGGEPPIVILYVVSARVDSGLRLLRRRRRGETNRE